MSQETISNHAFTELVPSESVLPKSEFDLAFLEARAPAQAKGWVFWGDTTNSYITGGFSYNSRRRERPSIAELAEGIAEPLHEDEVICLHANEGDTKIWFAGRLETFSILAANLVALSVDTSQE